MSIQIFQDTENVNPGFPHGKKIKREDGLRGNNNRSKIPKPNKRVALSTISQNGVHRIQPSRAAKGRVKANLGKNSIEQKTGFSVFCDESAAQNKPPPAPSLQENELFPKDSPMVFSPPLCSADSFEDIQCDPNKSLIENINLRTDPLFGMPEYAADIYKYLKNSEGKFCPKPHYMKKQADITSSMRAILVDWLVEVAEEYKLKPQTLFLTINYIDRFLSYMSVLRGKLQLVGAACMLVAAKFEEIYPPEVKEFVYITDDTYTAKQILRMEHLVLKALAFNLSVPTCRDFLSRYIAAADAPLESQQQFLSEYLCELVLVDLDASVKYPPSMIAASSVCLTNITMDIPTWSHPLEFFTDYKLEDISTCVKDLHTLFKNAAKLQQQAVQTKYKAPRYASVSQITPPGDRKVLDLLIL